MGTPVAEYEITPELVRALLGEQFPRYAKLAIAHLDSGFDNEMYRLGEELLVRMPRRQVANELVRNEQRWLPALAEQLDITIPAPLHVGVPALGYPWSFSVLPWIVGEAADLGYPKATQAGRLASCLKTLHQIKTPASTQAPENSLRGVPLAERRQVIEERIGRLRKANEFAKGLERVWHEALSAPVTQQSVWLHGDLHARNVLVNNGELVALIDWGDVTAGDAATDLASLWMLFTDDASRNAALQEYGADAHLIARSKGWALSFGVMLLDTGLVDHPRHAAMGRRTLQSLL